MPTPPTLQTLLAFFRDLPSPGRFEGDGSIGTREAGLLFVEHWLETPGLDLSGLTAQEQEALFVGALVQTGHRKPEDRARVAERLMGLGLDPWTASGTGWGASALKALMQADRQNSTHMGLLKTLMTDPRRPPDWDAVEIKPGQPLLHGLVEMAAGPLVALALEAGADPNRRCAHGTTPVAQAATPRLLDQLVKHGGRVSGSGWRQVQSGGSSPHPGALLKAYFGHREAELGAGVWDGWADMTKAALNRLNLGKPELLSALLDLFRTHGRCLPWPSPAGSAYAGWPVLPALCARRLAQTRDAGAGGDSGAVGSHPPAPWLDKSASWTPGEVLMGLENHPHDWAHESAPGIPDGVWPALLMWSKKPSESGVKVCPAAWTGGAPERFWGGVLTQFEAWCSNDADRALRTRILASLCSVKAWSAPGAPPVSVFDALRHRWLEDTRSSGKLTQNGRLEGYEVVLVGLCCQEASRGMPAAPEQAPESIRVWGDRWLGLICTDVVSPRQCDTLMEALEGLPACFTVGPARAASVREFLHERFQPNSARSCRMEAWLLSRMLPEGASLPRVRL